MARSFTEWFTRNEARTKNQIDNDGRFDSVRQVATMVA
jgi:hypothetical protein